MSEFISANLNFGTSTIDPFPQSDSLGIHVNPDAPRYFSTYADLEICRRPRFAMQSPGVVEGYCSPANSYLIKKSPTNLLVSRKNDFEFTLKSYRDI